MDKLANEADQKAKAQSFLEIIKENENQEVVFKVASTKTRNIRSIIATPNSTWNGSHDLIGLHWRKERYDEAYDNCFPMT